MTYLCFVLEEEEQMQMLVSCNECPILAHTCKQ